MHLMALTTVLVYNTQKEQY